MKVFNKTKGVGINWIGLSTFIRQEMSRMMRVKVQVFLAPLISAFLFIFIFGFVLGRKIDLIAGVPYIKFVFPGILMMNIIQSAFLHSSNSVYFGRFLRQIDEILTAPFSYIEMIIGYTVSAVVRAFIIAIGVVIVGLLFSAVSLAHPFIFIFYVIGVSAIFALLGIIVGLWANGFEQLSILNTFVILPLSFLGGIFYSLSLLPPSLQTITILNPFFYFVDGIRYSMIGINEGNLLLGVIVVLGLVLGIGTLVWYLFKISWRLRD